MPKTAARSADSPQSIAQGAATGTSGGRHRSTGAGTTDLTVPAFSASGGGSR